MASTMLYSDNPKDSYYEPEDKRVYRIVTNYEDLRKESQMLLEKYRREQFRKVLKDKFIDSDEDDYEAWLEEQCRAYAEKISQMEGERNQLATSLKVLIDGYAALIKGMICKEATKKQKNISKIDAYNDWEIGWWSRSIVASTMLYSDNPKDSYYEPEDKRVYRIVTNYEDLRKESQILLEKYRREQFCKGLKDKFIDSDEDDYEAWLEKQCRTYAEKISQMEGEQNLRDASYKSLLTGFHFVLKGMIQQAQKKPEKDISKINAYKDCLLKFEGMFEGKL